MSRRQTTRGQRRQRTCKKDDEKSAINHTTEQIRRTENSHRVDSSAKDKMEPSVCIETMDATRIWPNLVARQLRPGATTSACVFRRNLVRVQSNMSYVLPLFQRKPNASCASPCLVFHLCKQAAHRLALAPRRSSIQRKVSTSE